MTMEIQNQLPFGLGWRVQRWPLTRHYILHVGSIESRIIVRDHRSLASIVCLLVAGWIAGLSR